MRQLLVLTLIWAGIFIAGVIWCIGEDECNASTYYDRRLSHMPDKPKRNYWPLIDGVPLNFILSLPAVRVWLLGSALLLVAHSGWFPAGSPVMYGIGWLLSLLGLGGAAAAHPPKPQWTLDQYNQWRLGKGLPVMSEDEWKLRRGLSGMYPVMAPPPLPPPGGDDRTIIAPARKPGP
jgi:hypothetical protein